MIKLWRMNRKEFILTGTAAALMPKVFAAEKSCAENEAWKSWMKD